MVHFDAVILTWLTDEAFFHVLTHHCSQPQTDAGLVVGYIYIAAAACVGAILTKLGSDLLV